MMRVGDIIKNNELWKQNKRYEEYEPEVTVLLPTFRRAQSGLFEKAVMSVINQTFQKWELIIIDDASTDGTETMIEKFMKLDGRINSIRHINNVGLPAISEFEGYRKGRGTYFAFIFDDNIWEKDFLYQTYVLMERVGCKASFGLAKGYTDIERDEYVTFGEGDSFETNALWMHNYIANGSVVLHRDVIEDVGLYDPHLSVTRLCDWDLWRRIVKKYNFQKTRINATREMGFCLKDSLGNSYMMNQWCSLERMNEERDERLRPCNFENVDIVEILPNSTDYYRDTMQALIGQFSKKNWYTTYVPAVNGGYTSAKRKKRIVVVHDGLTATVSLTMLRLFDEHSDYVVKYSLGSINKNDLLLADVVIAIRSVLLNSNLVEYCNKLKVPCFYYVDDNFIELSKDYPDNTDLQMLAKETTKTSLQKYDAIIVSTESLREYFLNRMLHKNVICMPPLIDCKNIKKASDVKLDVFNVGFLGGAWRSEPFMQYVFPAILKIAKNKKVNLYLPIGEDENERKQLEYYINDNFKIYFLKRSLSLEIILRQCLAVRIDVLIHCSKNMKNNKYKTENALINATQIGAVLLASADAPFDKSSMKNKGFLTADSVIDDWEEKLESLLDVNLRLSLYNNAHAYCLDNYSVPTGGVGIFELLDAFPDSSYLKYFEKAEILLNTGKYPSVVVGNEKSFRDIRLGLATLIKNDISYNVTCPIDDLHEIGLLFGSYDLRCSGQMKVSIYRGKKMIFSEQYPLSYFVRDDWTYLSVGSHTGLKGKVLTLVFECIYDLNSAQVGFFEDLDRRPFFYKVFNKLGHHIKGNNAIVVDYR